MHEMPMTTAPMRPTVPALRPFLEMPPASSPDVRVSGARGALGSAHRCSPSSGGGARARRSWGPAVRAASSPRSSRGRGGGGCARRLEPTSTSSPGCQSRRRDGLLDVSPRGDDDVGVDVVGQRRRAAASTSSACAVLASADDARVDAGGQVDARRARRAAAGAGARRSRGRRIVEQRVGAGPRADRGGDAGDAGRAGRPRREPAGASATGTSDECSSSVATDAEAVTGRSRPPLAAPTTMSDAPNSCAAAMRPSANDSA